MEFLTKSPDDYLAIAVLLGIAAFIGGYLVGHWFGKQDYENHIKTLRDTLKAQARVISRHETRGRRTQEGQETRRLSR